MGSKRCFEDRHFRVFPSKHPKLFKVTETYPFIELPQKADFPVECDGQYFEDERKEVVSNLTEKEVEISAPYSWVTCSSSEEEGGSGVAVSSSLSAEYLQFCFPSSSVVQLEDACAYSLSLDGTPAMQIPLGLDYQAELPVWDPQAIYKYGFGYDPLMGDCVVPMLGQECSAQGKIGAGDGRKDCDCSIKGSSTCVEQHVRKAREGLRSEIGPEKFVKLGFCDMGEDVSQLWTAEEERLFHDIVYSNPISHNKNFWDHLSTVFPSRTNKEIVSYYFNVFMLHRRSVQNRSNFLDIDSDDDEWNMSYWEPVDRVREDEDSVNDYPNINENIEVNYADNFPVANEVDKNEGCCKDGLHENGARSSADGFDTSPLLEPPHDKVRDDSFANEVDKNEVCRKDGSHENGAGSSADGFNASHLLEPPHDKVWDDSFVMSPFRFHDLLSTGKMIEEIFGASPSRELMF